MPEPFAAKMVSWKCDQLSKFLDCLKSFEEFKTDFFIIFLKLFMQYLELKLLIYLIGITYKRMLYLHYYDNEYFRPMLLLPRIDT